MEKGTAPLRRLAELWKRHPFRLHIAVLFGITVLAAGAVLVWSNYVQGRAIVLSAAEDVFARIEREIRSELQHVHAPVESAVDWMSRSPIVDAASADARAASIPVMADALNKHPMLDAIYVGYYNGDFFLLRALRADADRERFAAPRHAAFRMQSIERGARRARFGLLDAALNVISTEDAPDEYNFDPRTRPWYIAGMAAFGLVKTAPYVFFTTGETGETIARRADHGRAVVGADLTLKRLSGLLSLARPSPSSHLAIFQEGGGVISYSTPMPEEGGAKTTPPNLSKLAEVSPVIAASRTAGKSAAVEMDGREWMVRSAQMSQTSAGATYLAVAIPSDELLVEARGALRRNVWLALALVVATIAFAWWVAHRIASNLNALADEAAAIRRFDFRAPPEIASRIVEIHELGSAMARMRQTIRKFLEISTALAAERKFDRLLARVLEEAREAAGASGGIVYLLDEQAATLKPEHQHWPLPGETHEVPDIPLADESNPVVRAARSSDPAVHPMPAERTAQLPFLQRRFGAAQVTLVTVPLLERNGTLAGVMCLFLGPGEAAPSLERLALVQAFAGAGAVAIHNQRLLAAQKALFNSLIALIAGAIDAKSHHTAGHCERVPVLTSMLARAACDAKDGPFAGFTLDEDQWEALQVASGLHDCGKVTTPEYVVDKATKLETLHDRIHEVRMRFEVLKRDAEIACLKAIAAGADASERQAALESQHRELDEEFAFVATCNVGDEFMAPEKIERLKAIAARTWMRTLDDRLGISWEEADRKARSPGRPLPAAEPLLADRPEHVIERQANDILKEDNPWGFKLDMPAALYNRGEIYNLSISRGTLTDEERYKINDHIVQTIIMLDALPFPPHLKSVPELAGGHHERMDGKGYPRRLSREHMSVPARAMAIADIFEALTAADRPYKKAKKLSEAVRIMDSMKKNGHVDPDLFELFLKSGVYRAYAERFMPPEFVDDVDVARYVAATA